MNVLVTGGTGTLGRHVVMQLRQTGHRARIFSREPRGHVDAVQGDLASGAGLVKAVAGMDAIIHAASATRDVLRGRAVDVLGTRRLLAMARDAGVRHVVYVSIVGIDKVAYPYYRAKLAAEAIVRENLVPWSILRATQFHDFMEFLLGGFSRVPGVTAIPVVWQFQPVDAREVAQRLAEVVLGEPAGMCPDFGGPEIQDFKSIANQWIAARKLNRRVTNLPIPLKLSRQIAQGGLLCPDHKAGKLTFAEHLAQKYPLS
jgi:uncharacterized protein YbjT (DUF2867 family)